MLEPDFIGFETTRALELNTFLCSLMPTSFAVTNVILVFAVKHTDLTQFLSTKIVVNCEIVFFLKLHDFESKGTGSVIVCGVQDNTGIVAVGRIHIDAHVTS